jgi:lipopolysaccharide export LptBFGC system permease protein LptF
MVGIEAGVFSSAFDGMVIYVDKMESLDKMEGIFISDEHSAKDPYSIVAKRGKLITDPRSFKVTLAMEEGAMYAMPRDKDKYLLSSSPQAVFSRHQPFPAAGRIFDHGLPERVPPDPAHGHQVASRRATDFQISELHMRLSIPVACDLRHHRRSPGHPQIALGRSAGIAIALAVFFLYYVLIGTSKNLAETGSLSPAAAYWILNASIGVRRLAPCQEQ